MEGYLIIGLGNPGKAYENTRHNVGFQIVKALAARHGILLRPSLVRAKGSIGKGEIREIKTHLLLPLTYMNESGAAVRKSMDYYKIPLEQLIVVTDDVDLPFGGIRIRPGGGCGGHNGLRSIESYLGTQEYARMRVGVGGRSTEELADYVLDQFTNEEQRVLPEIVDRAIQGIESWLCEGVETAMQKTNRAGET